MMYFINLFLLIAEGMFFLLYLPQKRSQTAPLGAAQPSARGYVKVFCVLASLQWILLSGLRHLTIGADTYEYVSSFHRAKAVSWQSLWTNFTDVLFKGVEGKDPGFSFFEKFCNTVLGDQAQLYLLLIALLFFIPMGYFVYKYSAEPFTSFLLFSCLFYAFFAITGIRQTIATAFSVLVGYHFVVKRKFLPFLLLILLMATVHKSCLVFLIFYFIANKKLTKPYCAVMLALIPIVFLFKTQIKVFFVQLTGYEDYLKNFEGAGTYTFTLVLILVLIVALWRKNAILERNPQAVHYFNALFLAAVIVPITFVNPSAMRVVQYFSIFLMLLIPEIILSFKEKERPFVLVLIATVLIVLFARTNPTYLFFWQR